MKTDQDLQDCGHDNTPVLSSLVPPHVSRMVEERKGLGVRVKALKEFLAEDQEKPLEFLSARDRLDLREQLYHMENYHWVLNRRIQRTGIIDNNPEKQA